MDNTKQTTAEEWEEKFPLIVSKFLNCKEEDLLVELGKLGFYPRQAGSTWHGFFPCTDINSRESCKKRLNYWRRIGRLPPKNIKKGLKDFMARKAVTRRSEEGKETAFRHKDFGDRWEISSASVQGFVDDLSESWWSRSNQPSELHKSAVTC